MNNNMPDATVPTENSPGLTGSFGSETWTKEEPAIPAVYRVALLDPVGRRHEMLAGRQFHAYWDGVDTWSDYSTDGVKDARRRKMLKPNAKPYEWIGAAL
jgi:hypothetical protein